MQWMIYYTLCGGEATITRCVGDGAQLTLPEHLEGCPVTALGPDCFSVPAEEVLCEGLEPVFVNGPPPEATGRGSATLRRLRLPDGIRELGARCFARCTALPRLELPRGVSKVGERCFHGCTSLEHLELPDGINVLPEYTFAECRHLRALKLPKHLRAMGRCCLYNCTSLEGLDLPDALESIGDRMLMNCFSLRELSFRIGVNGGALLAEVDRVIRVRVRYPEETVELVVTEYALEYEELIQAKQFRTNETGSGGLYRGCFSDRDVDFALYDTYFYTARLQDPPELLAELAYDRLRWPRELRPAREREYWEFLLTHITDAANFLLRGDRLDALDFLLTSGRLEAEHERVLLEAAQRADNVRFVSRLLEAAGTGVSSGADKAFDL